MMTAFCPFETSLKMAADGQFASGFSLPSCPLTAAGTCAQIGLRLINSTSYAFTYVTGVANTGARNTSLPVPTVLPTQVYLSTTPGAAANGTMFTGYVTEGSSRDTPTAPHAKFCSC